MLRRNGNIPKDHRRAAWLARIDWIAFVAVMSGLVGVAILLAAE